QIADGHSFPQLLLFERHGALRDLHSFPTRRSSDLGAIAGGIASALAGGAMSKLFGGGQKAASGGIQGDVLATDNNTVGMAPPARDRKSGSAGMPRPISYAVFCLKKKTVGHDHVPPSP